MQNDSAIALLHDAADEMLSRLAYIRIEPQQVYVAGCRQGELTKKLARYFPNAIVTPVSQDKVIRIESVADCLIANCALFSEPVLSTALQAWHRLIRQEGLLALTVLGPSSLQELFDLPVCLAHMHEMHTLGDELVRAGFADPVMDVELLTVTYRDAEKLLNEMQACGMLTEVVDRAHCLRMLNSKKNPQGVFSLTLEVVHAHAWRGAAVVSTEADGEVRFPLRHLLRSTRLNPI